MILKRWVCTIKDYPTEIKVSDSRRANFWKSDDTLPKKYEDKTKYSFDKEGYLIDSLTKLKVVQNTKTAGKPRTMPINAQKIYVGIHHAVRSKIVNELHDLFYKEFKKQLPSKIDLDGGKLIIGIKFYGTYHNKLPDLDNLSNLFIKCGIDCLTSPNNPNQIKGNISYKLSVIPDDKIKYIAHIFYEFIESPDKKMDFIIYKVDDNFCMDDVLNNQFLKEKPEDEEQV